MNGTGNQIRRKGAEMDHGCQMVCFQTKNPNLGKFWRVFQMEDFGIFYEHLVHFLHFVIFYGHWV
jgi:hypothetical protein